jgi:hypothetical protein
LTGPWFILNVAELPLVDFRLEAALLSRIEVKFRIGISQLGIILLGLGDLFRSYYGHWRWSIFDFAERRGIHVLPVHYYTPVPDTRLASCNPETWAAP